MRMMQFTAQRTAKKTVQRFRLRSTSEPPPNGPEPVPTPNAPDRPASFPECRSTRKMTTTDRTTWTTERMFSSTAGECSQSLSASSSRRITTASARS